MTRDPMLESISMRALDIASNDRARDFSNKAVRAFCYAPFNSIYLDTLGNVRVCCQNQKYSLGNIARERLKDIWRGPRARALRKAMMADNLKLGCDYCQWQLDEGNVGNLFVKNFETFPVTSDDPPWPHQIEFAISNTCNLECVMCNGELSSTIRARREKLPPLPKVYGDEFFEDLREFLPHAGHLKFLGGEPFLARETLRVCDLLIELRLSPPCHFTTNGTQRNPTVERILDCLPVSLAISLDGATKETVERLRVNARYDELMANLRWFRDYTQSRGTTLDLTYCLMRENWREFGDYLALGDDFDCDVKVNTVTQPAHMSLMTLPRERLAEVVDDLERRDAAFRSRLARNRNVWVTQLDVLRHRLQQPDGPLVDVRLLSGERVPTSATDAEDRARRLLREWSDGAHVDAIVCDADDRIIEVRAASSEEFLGVPAGILVGQSIAIVANQMRRRFGQQNEELSQEKTDLWHERLVRFTNDAGQRTLVRALLLPLATAQGMLMLASHKPGET